MDYLRFDIPLSQFRLHYPVEYFGKKIEEISGCSEPEGEELLCIIRIPPLES